LRASGKGFRFKKKKAEKNKKRGVKIVMTQKKQIWEKTISIKKTKKSARDGDIAKGK